VAGLEHPRRRHISATPEDDAQSRPERPRLVESIASLRRVAQFVDLWHGLDTGLEQLPPLLNAELCRRSGGRLILGFAIIFGPVCQVVINSRVNQTLLAKPVLAHECAHLLLGVRGVRMCSGELCASDEERSAWYGAALLAVPSARIQALQSGAVRARHVANECNVPVEFVDLRCALREYLEARDSTRDSVGERVERAYWRWIAKVRQAASSL
jgi:hypothetical protein